MLRLTTAGLKFVIRYSVLALSVAYFTPNAHSSVEPSKDLDTVVLKVPNSRALAAAHDEAVVRLALQKTRSDFGPFELIINRKGRTTARVFKELGTNSDNTKLNATVSVTSKQREEMAHAIKIPVRMGLLNYRLLVTKENFLRPLAKVNSLEDLKPFRNGVLEQWSTTPILENAGFNVVKGQQSSAIYKMLHADRYDYILRGVSEIYSEKKLRHLQFGDAIIEPKLLVYLATPYYVFISPRKKRLIKRIETGLERAIADGSFQDTFFYYFREHIERSDLVNRKVLYIENPHMQAEPVLLRPELWYASNPNIFENLKDNY